MNNHDSGCQGDTLNHLHTFSKACFYLHVYNVKCIMFIYLDEMHRSVCGCILFTEQPQCFQICIDRLSKDTHTPAVKKSKFIQSSLGQCGLVWVNMLLKCISCVSFQLNRDRLTPTTKNHSQQFCPVPFCETVCVLKTTWCTMKTSIQKIINVLCKALMHMIV